MKILPFDVHCHILPGVDDGFRTASDSLEAISLMAQAGCREIVFTPHMNPDVYPDESEEHFREVYDSFVPQIPSEWGVKTSLAAEYMIVPGFEERAAKPEFLLCRPDGSILVEMSYMYRSSNLEQTLFDLNMAGLHPILAHPERYPYMSRRLKDFERLQDIGCRFQMNYLSLSGKYGPESLRILSHLLDEGMYSFVATDLHSTAQLRTILESVPVRKVRKSFEKFLSNSVI